MRQPTGTVKRTALVALSIFLGASLLLFNKRPAGAQPDPDGTWAVMPDEIDEAISGRNRETLVAMMEQLPPEHRVQVIVVTYDGKVLSNRLSLLYGLQTQLTLTELDTGEVTKLPPVLIGLDPGEEPVAPGDEEPEPGSGGTTTGGTTGGGTTGGGSSGGTTGGGTTAGSTTGGSTTGGTTGGGTTGGGTSGGGGIGSAPLEPIRNPIIPIVPNVPQVPIVTNPPSSTGGFCTSCSAEGMTPKYSEPDVRSQSGPYLRYRTRRDRQLTGLHAQVYLPFRGVPYTSGTKELRSYNLLHDLSFLRVGEAGTNYIYFGTRGINGRGESDVGVAAKNDAEVYSPFVFLDDSYIASYEVAPGVQARWEMRPSIFFKSHSILDAKVRLGNRQVAYTFTGTRCGFGGNPVPDQNVPLTIITNDPQDRFQFAASAPQRVDFKWVTSIAQQQSAPRDIRDADHWFCGVHWMMVQGITGVNHSTEWPIQESVHIANTTTHPALIYRGGFQVPQFETPIFTQRLSSGTNTVPFAELVSIDVRRQRAPGQSP